jgi:hypothetical protein
MIFEYLRSVPDLLGPYRSALLLLGAGLFLLAGITWGAMRLIERWMPSDETDHFVNGAAGPRSSRRRLG